MSALCGIFYRNGNPMEAEAISPAMNALVGYGHDGSATWRGTHVALGFQALHVIPESIQEPLPYYDSESQCGIVSDVRLDNRNDLSASLGLDDHDSRLLPDSQLILKAYLKWDVGCLEHLLGDFAFAVWDQRQQRMFCARDIMGVRPFYYHLAADYFVFASDMNGVRAAIDTPDDIDLPFVSAYLREGWNYPHSERTFYAGVLKLPRAHGMTVDADGARTWAYWDPQNLPEVRLKSNDDYVQQLQTLLSQSVQARVRSAFPVAAHLSGGLDSSSIAVLAARQLKSQGQTLQGYSWAPPPESLPWQSRSPECSSRIIADERQLVEQLSQREGIPVYHSEVTATDVVAQRLRKAGTIYDAEFVHEYPVRRHAELHDVRTILSGWGGDELIGFNGRGYFPELFGRGRWWRLWREANMRATIQEQSAWKLVFNAAAAHRPAWLMGRHRSANGDSHAPLRLPSQLFRTDFVTELMAVEPLPPRNSRYPLKVRGYQLGLLAREHLSRRIEGWASAGGQAGLTYAYPLLDQRIVEFSLGLPAEMFFKNGWNRYLFREALSGILPDNVRWNRTKKEPALMRDRSQTGPRAWSVLRPFLNDLLSSSRDYHFLERHQVQALIQKNIAEDADDYYALRIAMFMELLVNQKLADDAQQQLTQLRQDLTKPECAA